MYFKSYISFNERKHKQNSVRMNIAYTWTLYVMNIYYNFLQKIDWSYLNGSEWKVSVY